MWVVGRPMAIQMEQHHGWCQPQLLWWLCRPQLEWQPWYEGGTDSWNGNCSADLGKENKKISDFFKTCQSSQIQLDFIRSCGCILHSHVSEYLILLNSEYYLNYNKLTRSNGCWYFCAGWWIWAFAKRPRKTSGFQIENWCFEDWLNLGRSWGVVVWCTFCQKNEGKDEHPRINVQVPRGQ